MTGTILTGANLRGADLSAAIGLTREQLAAAKIDPATTKLPPQLR